MKLTCSCPSTDGVECLQIRYSLNLDEALLEPCDCDCHKPENQSKTVYEWEEDPYDPAKLSIETIIDTPALRLRSFRYPAVPSDTAHLSDTASMWKRNDHGDRAGISRRIREAGMGSDEDVCGEA